MGRPDAGATEGHALSVLTVPGLEPSFGLPQLQLGDDASDELSQDRFLVSKNHTRIIALTLSGRKIFIYDIEKQIISMVEAPKIDNATLTFRIDPSTQPQKDVFTALTFSPHGDAILACSGMGNIYFIYGGSLRNELTIRSSRTHAPCEAISYASHGDLIVALSKQFGSSVDSSRQSAGLHAAIFDRFNELLDVYQSSDERHLSTVDLGFYSAEAMEKIPQTNELAKADSKDVSVISFSESGQITETQHFGTGAFTLAVSDDGRIASVEGSDVVIYSEVGAN